MAVFVLDKHRRPLMSCSVKRARLLLQRGRAVVHKRYPFTLRLKDCVGGDTQPLRLGIDPSSKTTERGSYQQRTRLTRHGFPRGYLMCQKRVKGFQTGDMVKAIVPTGKMAGTHTGRVAVRKAGTRGSVTQSPCGRRAIPPVLKVSGIPQKFGDGLGCKNAAS